MATTPTKPGVEGTSPLRAASVPAWPLGPESHSGSSGHYADSSDGGFSNNNFDKDDEASQKPSRLNALQALLAFSALHEQVRRRKALAAQHKAFDAGVLGAEFDQGEQFLLDEVLQLVAERAVAITGADGLAIALAENDEIVLRASAGMVRPDVGARIDRDSAFSGASFRTAQIVNCDDTETDSRVNLQACRHLGARSMVAVPLCGRRRVIGLLEAFSTWPFGFNDSDVRNLTLLAELIVSALRPEDEDRFAQSAQVAETKLQPVHPASPSAAVAPAVIRVDKARVESAWLGDMSTPPAPRVESVKPETAQPAKKPAVSPSTSSPSVSAPSIPSPSVAPSSVASPTPTAPQISVTPKPATPAAPVASVPVQASPSLSPVAPVVPAEPSKTPSGISAAASLLAAIEASAKTPVIQSSETPAPATKTVEIKTPEIHTPETQTPEFVASEPELALVQEPDQEAETHGRTLILLICIVVGFALAAGAWWKWPAAQLGSEHVTEKIHESSPAKSSAAPAPTSKPSSTPATTAPASSPNASTDAVSNESAPAPATPQELAKFPHITGIRHWSSADSSTVVLDLEDQVQYEPHRLSGPDRIYFDLYNTQLAPELVGKSIDIGDALLNRVRVAQPVAGMTRVVLETRGDSNFSVSLEPNPYRLVVEVRKLGANPHGAVNLFPDAEAEKNRLAIVIPPPTKEDLKLRALVPKMRIVVDAGHGGWDLGTVGRRGLLEKNLVLEIAERLGKLLENRLGSEVILTRNDDNYIPLDQRAEIANQAQADLFVSVHANYSDLPSARGVETYYTTSFSSPSSKEPGSNPATLKDASQVSGQVAGQIASQGKTAPTLSSADLHERIEQSRRLAASVQRSLYGTLVVENPGLRDRGIKEAGFVVLTESAMPGILAEVSFVSSPTDEQKLRSDEYREQIAEALYRGIARYAATSKNVKVAAK